MKISNVNSDSYKVTFEQDETFIMTLDEVIHLLHAPKPSVAREKTTQELFDEFWESEPVFPLE